MSTSSSPLIHCAGFAQKDITPDYPLHLTGFGSPRVRLGKRGPRPLLAQAAFFAAAEGQGFLVFAIDLIGFDSNWALSLRRKLSEHLGLPVERIVLNASHTHCGPQVRCEEEHGALQPCDPVYREQLAHSLFTLGMEAFAQRKPCHASSAVGVNRQVTHRRLWRDGQWFNAPNPADEPDRTLPVLTCDWPDGRRLIVATMSGHPTTSAAPVYDSHYQGATRQRLKQELGGQVETMILSGLSGDSKMTNQNLSGKGWLNDLDEDIRLISLRATADILHALTGAASMEPWIFRSVSEIVPLSLWKRPFPDLAPEPAAEQIASHGKIKEWENARLSQTRAYEIDLVAWNDSLRWVVTGGEMCGGYGPLLRGLFDHGATTLVGYSQNMISYIPTERITVEGGYEGNRAFSITKDGSYFPPYHPDIEREIVACVQRLKNSLRI
jgi:hypothetical protein